MGTDAAGERILLWRATARTWVRWRKLLRTSSGAPRLYVHLAEVGTRRSLCGRMTADRVVEADQPKRLCPHCSRLSR